MFSEAKAIGKAIKAKGLGKLKWYCEVCKKQCRDENGFQNHLTTEGHLRNVSLFAEDSKKYIHQYSSDFQQGFLDIVRTRFKTVTVRATLVYNEYIKDRHHTHMNATRWETLTAFCHHLARAGIVEIGNDASGFLTIRYVEKDPEMIERERRMRAREEMEATDSERSARVLAMQVEAARQEKMVKKHRHLITFH
jgi:DNA/RNA-binding protein KIN17